MDNQRLILFAALSVIIVMLWSAWEGEQRSKAPAPAVKSDQIPTTPGPSAGQVATSPTTTPKITDTTLASGERIEVTTDLVHVVIDTQGGDIRQLDLLHHPVDVDHPQTPLRLLADQGTQLFIAQSGLITREGALPNHKSRYRAESTRYELANGLDQLQVRLHWDGPDGMRVAKVFTFHRNQYQIDLTYELTNTSRKPRDAYLYAQWRRNHVEEGSRLLALPSYTGGVIYTPDKRYEKIAFDDMTKKVLARDTEGGWVAMIQHYFVGAWLPAEKQALQFYTDTEGGNQFFIGYKTLAPVLIAPGAKATLSTRLYVGPKERHRLEKVAPGLELTVDYGWLTFIAAPLFWVLEWLHKVVGNWGWSIILLTLLIKLVFYPA